MTVPSASVAALREAFREDRVVDLTLPLAEDLPCTWPGHMPYQHKTFSWFERRRDGWGTVGNRTGAPYQTRWLCIDEHTGTHLDAPSHFVPGPGSGLPDAGPAGLLGMADVPVAQTAGPAVVIDVSGLTAGEGGRSARITPGDVRRWEEAHGPIRAGEVVLFASGWDDRYRAGRDGDAYAHAALVERRGPGWPAPAADTIGELVQRGVRCVGTDGVSMGPRIVDGTGGPGRAIALLPEEG
jgi:kynurenine formamidase